MERRYKDELEEFKRERQKYLIYGYIDRYAGKPGQVGVVVNNVPLYLDAAAYRQ